jgi:phosphoglycolate phosphatase
VHLLFDLDGTLTDSRDGISRSIRHAMATVGHELPADADLTFCLGPPLATSFERLLRTSDAGLIDRAIAAYRGRFEEIGMFENAVYPAIPHVLDVLRAGGHTLHVATAKRVDYAHRILTGPPLLLY